MKSGRFILGEKVSEFETEFANFCNAKYALGVGNGLDALFISLVAMGIGKGDEVIVPSNTYIATWIAVSRTGAIPVPAEPYRDTFNINPEEIFSHITERTKAIVPVDLYGQPCEIDKINNIASKHNIKILVDAAQSHGAQYSNKKVGSLSDVTAFSFYPTKNLGAFGDGGAIVTDDLELINKAAMLRNYGTVEKYNSEMIGINSRLDELQAAFLKVKLKHLETLNKNRQKNAKTYMEEIHNKFIELPVVAQRAIPVWHQFVIRTSYRDKLRRYLIQNSIDTIVHYPIPPHLQNAYQFLGYKRGSYPIAEKLAEEVLSIPIDPFLQNEELDYICKILNKFNI